MPSATTSTPLRFDWDELNRKATLARYEAAFFVGLSQRAFDERIGTLFPHVKLGRRTLFLRTSLLAALAKLERKASK
jgi:hypothetical protein